MYYCDDDPAFSNAVYDALIAAGQAATVPCIRRVRICRDGPEPVREIRTVHLPTPDQLTAGLRPADLVVHREVRVLRRCVEDVEHGGQAALGVGGTAPVEPSVRHPRVQRVRHRVQAHGVQVALEHQGRAVSAADPGQQVRPAGFDVVQLDVGAGGSGEVRDVIRKLGLAGAALEAGVDAVDGNQTGERFNDGRSDGRTSGGGATGKSGTRWGPRIGAFARNKSFSMKYLRRRTACFDESEAGRKDEDRTPPEHGRRKVLQRLLR